MAHAAFPVCCRRLGVAISKQKWSYQIHEVIPSPWSEDLQLTRSWLLMNRRPMVTWAHLLWKWRVSCVRSASSPPLHRVCDPLCAASGPERVNAMLAALKCEYICIKVCVGHPEMIKKGGGGGGCEFMHMSHFHYFSLVNSQIIDRGSII